MKSITLKAPAKINLSLKLLGVRPDDFCEISTLMQAVSLYDEITIEKMESGLVLSCNDSNVPLNSDNTVARAWAALCQLTGAELGAKIHIAKRIPIGSGLGGGSSDAASAIKGLNRLFELNFKRDLMMKVGAAIGSDIPFFFGNGSSIASGRGELIDNVKIPKDYYLLLVKPHFQMNTGELYGIAKKSLTMRINKSKYISLKDSDDIISLCSWGNDLEKPFLSVYPEAAKVKDRLVTAGAIVAALTGSGSAFFGVFSNRKCADISSNNFDDMWNSVVKPIEIE